MQEATYLVTLASLLTLALCSLPVSPWARTTLVRARTLDTAETVVRFL